MNNPNDYDGAELAAKDKRYIWHPFTQMQDYVRSDPVIVARGDGRKLIDCEGRAYYDGVSSLWVNVHGHRVPEIDAAIREQLDRVAHSTLLGQANVPSILLAEKLVAASPAGLERVFYSDSGSEAVEIGLKMAYMYWRLVGEPGRKYFVKMSEAYHGDTIGSVSVGGIDLFHATFSDLLFSTIEVPYPHPYRFAGTPGACAEHCAAALEEVLATRHREIIGLILEPLVQGAAGMIVMPEGFLARVETLCRQYGVLFLTDEVATGFGRTGKMFACDHEEVRPDILMAAKGLTGGYLPLAATLTTATIYDAFLGEYEEQKTFFHGHSYTGNQLGCAAALANLELFEKEDLVRQAACRGEALMVALKELEALPHVGELRGKGMMFGIELVRDKATKEPFAMGERIGVRVCQRCRELGMLLRPLGNVVVFMPPLASSETELAEMTTILKQALADVVGAIEAKDTSTGD